MTKDIATRLCPICGKVLPWDQFTRARHPRDNPKSPPGVNVEAYPTLWLCQACKGIFGEPRE